MFFFYKLHFFRELEEESSLMAPTLDKIGLLMFEFLGDPALMEVHVYQTEQYTGIPTESDGQYSMLRKRIRATQ
jgi:hypothetical protein